MRISFSKQQSHIMGKKDLISIAHQAFAQVLTSWTPRGLQRSRKRLRKGVRACCGQLGRYRSCHNNFNLHLYFLRLLSWTRYKHLNSVSGNLTVARNIYRVISWLRIWDMGGKRLRNALILPNSKWACHTFGWGPFARAARPFTSPIVHLHSQSYALRTIFCVAQVVARSITLVDLIFSMIWDRKHAEIVSNFSAWYETKNLRNLLPVDYR